MDCDKDQGYYELLDVQSNVNGINLRRAYKRKVIQVSSSLCGPPGPKEGLARLRLEDESTGTCGKGLCDA
jgi:hypothetical protein